MPKKEFEELEKAILHGDAMDAQILLVANRFPKMFHVGMLPDFKITPLEDKEASSAIMEELKAEQAKWDSEHHLLKCALYLDWKLIKSTWIGSDASRTS